MLAPAVDSRMINPFVLHKRVNATNFTGRSFDYFDNPRLHQSLEIAIDIVGHLDRCDGQYR